MEIQEIKAVEPSLKDSSDYLVALMVLKQVEADSELDPLLRTLRNNLDKSGVGANPYHLLNTMFSQEAIAESKAAYADIWDAIYKEIAESNIKATLEKSGYSQDEIAAIPQETLDHFGAVQVFEEKFPDEGSANYPLVQRLKDGKEMLFEALSSDAGKAALNAASWGISLATGGIVARLAIKGGAALASRLIQNESVHSFAGKVQGRVTNFLQRVGLPTGAIVTQLREFKETAKGVMASDSFQRYGKPSLALAGIALGAIVLGNMNHDKLIELASDGMTKGAELASTGSEAALNGLAAASDVASGAVNVTGDVLSHAGGIVAHAVTSPLDTLVYITSNTIEGAKNAGEFISEAANSAALAAGQAPDLIAGAAKSGYEAVAGATGAAIEGSRQFVADGLRGAGELVAGTASPDISAALESKSALTDALGVETPASVEPASTSVVAPHAYEIQKGDSLWKIAHDQFVSAGVEPTNQQIHEATQHLYEANKDLIGSNPDKIFTGNELRVDPALFAVKADPSADLKAMSEMLGTKPGFPIEQAVDSGSAVAPKPVSPSTDLSQLQQLLNSSPASSTASFAEAARRVANRDLDEGSLSM